MVQMDRDIRTGWASSGEDDGIPRHNTGGAGVDTHKPGWDECAAAEPSPKELEMP